MRCVLVTRPEAGTDETVRLLRERGFEAVMAPMLRIEPRPVPAGALAVAAVALTSAHAVPALPPGCRGLPVFAVGDRTAAAARDAGCGDVRSADGTAVELAELMLREVRGTVLLMAGAGQGAGLAAALRAGGVRVVRRVAYAAQPVRALPAAAAAALAGDGVHGVVLMSAATARQFGRLAGTAAALAGAVAACISEATAAPVRHLPWRALRVSLRPNLRDTLDLL